MAHAGTLAAKAASGDVDDVVASIRKGTDPNEPDMYLNTPLHHACLAGFIPVVDALLDLGADINSVNAQGASILQFAAHNGAPEMMTVLLSRGKGVIDLNHQNTDGKTGLYSAVGNNYADIAAMILEAGADPNLSDKQKNSPLHKCAQKGFIECTRLLLSYGADVNLKNQQGKTAYDIADSTGKTELLSLLIGPRPPRGVWWGDDDEKNDWNSARDVGSTASPITQVQKPGTPAPSATPKKEALKLPSLPQYQKTPTMPNYDTESLPAVPVLNPFSNSFSTAAKNATASPSIYGSAPFKVDKASAGYVVIPKGASASLQKTQQQSAGRNPIYAAYALVPDLGASASAGVLPQNAPDVREKGVTLFPFTGTKVDELAFDAGKTMYIMEAYDDGWSMGELENGLIGMFPSHFVKITYSPNVQDLVDEKSSGMSAADAEAEVERMEREINAFETSLRLSLNQLAILVNENAKKTKFAYLTYIEAQMKVNSLQEAFSAEMRNLTTSISLSVSSEYGDRALIEKSIGWFEKSCEADKKFYSRSFSEFIGGPLNLFVEQATSVVADIRWGIDVSQNMMMTAKGSLKNSMQISASPTLRETAVKTLASVHERVVRNFNDISGEILFQNRRLQFLLYAGWQKVTQARKEGASVVATEVANSVTAFAGAPRPQFPKLGTVTWREDLQKP